MGQPEDNATDDPLVGRTIADRYRVQRLLGAGGMGAVYEAEHVMMQKRVALKVLHRELTHMEEVVARFEREAVAAGRIQHPNVVAATDFGRLDDGAFYLILEFVDGQSLSALIEEGPFEPERAVTIAREVAVALEAAHGAGIVHRDLKPDNIMIIGDPTGPQRVKVLDFGIAKVGPPKGEDAQTQLTRIGTVMGTATYMSPEQALGQPVDERTDLYALGIILHEMLSGQPPFHAEEVTQVLAQQITQPPPPLPESVPGEVSELVRALLEKTPDERPPSAQEVRARLDELLAAPTSAAGFAAPVTVRGNGGPASGHDRTLLDAPAIVAAATNAVHHLPGGSKRVGAVAGVAVAMIALGAWLASDDEDSEGEPAAMASAAPASSEPGRASAVIDPKTGKTATATAVGAPARRTAVKAPGSRSGASKAQSSSSRTTTETRTATNGASKTTKTTQSTQSRSTQTKSSSSKKRLRIPPPREWFR